MRAIIQQVYDITNKIYQVAHQEITEDNYEEIIGQLTELFAERSQVMSKIVPPYSEEELEIGKDISNLNQLLERRFEVLLKLTLTDWQLFKRKKEHLNVYRSRHKPKPIDGVFYDKRK